MHSHHLQVSKVLTCIRNLSAWRTHEGCMWRFFDNIFVIITVIGLVMLVTARHGCKLWPLSQVENMCYMSRLGLWGDFKQAIYPTFSVCTIKLVISVSYLWIQQGRFACALSVKLSCQNFELMSFNITHLRTRSRHSRLLWIPEAWPHSNYWSAYITLGGLCECVCL